MDSNINWLTSLSEWADSQLSELPEYAMPSWYKHNVYNPRQEELRLRDLNDQR